MMMLKGVMLITSLLCSTSLVYGMGKKRTKLSRGGLSSSQAMSQGVERPAVPSHTLATDLALFQKYDYGVNSIASFENLILSNIAPAENLEFLKELGITHILNLTAYNLGETTESGEPELRFPPKFRDQFEYLHLPFPDDNSPETIAKFKSEFLRPGHEFIAKALQKEGNRVLVHCEAGISRSSTMMISYLMLMKNPGHPLTLREAFQIVHARKPNIGPNNKFFEALVNLEAKLAEENRYPENVAIPSYSVLDYLADSVLKTAPDGTTKEQAIQALQNFNMEPNPAILSLWSDK